MNSRGGAGQWYTRERLPQVKRWETDLYSIGIIRISGRGGRGPSLTSLFFFPFLIQWLNFNLSGDFVRIYCSSTCETCLFMCEREKFKIFLKAEFSYSWKVSHKEAYLTLYCSSILREGKCNFLSKKYERIKYWKAKQVIKFFIDFLSKVLNFLSILMYITDLESWISNRELWASAKLLDNNSITLLEFSLEIVTNIRCVIKYQKFQSNKIR